jgi:hypothetical protein
MFLFSQRQGKFPPTPLQRKREIGSNICLKPHNKTVQKTHANVSHDTTARKTASKANNLTKISNILSYKLTNY